MRRNNYKTPLFYMGTPFAIALLAEMSGPLVLTNMFLAPVLTLSFIYGVYLLFKKDDIPRNMNRVAVPKKRSKLTLGWILVMISVLLFGIGYYLVWNVEQTVGYSGSEGSIVAIPFYISSFVVFILAIVRLVIEADNRNK